jgi:pimeloyl-ACP methyl ester carboxylesterase
MMAGRATPIRRLRRTRVQGRCDFRPGERLRGEEWGAKVLEGQWERNAGSPAAVVFLHGWHSDRGTAWTAANGAYWPALVPAEVADVPIDVLTLEYPTGAENSTYTITDAVSLVEAALRLEGVLERQAVIIVAHSMGGLIARRWLLDNQLALIAGAKRVGLMLVASPSEGSEYANHTRLLARLLGDVQQRVLVAGPANDWLQALDRSFRRLVDDGSLALWGLELVEDLAPTILGRLPLVGRFIGPIVSETSASRYFGSAVKIPGSTHSSIAKPESADALQNRLLASLLSEVVAGTRDDVRIAGPAAVADEGDPILPEPVFVVRDRTGDPALVKLVNFVASGPVHGVCVVVGDSDSGKTTLLRRVRDESKREADYWDLRTPPALATFMYEEHAVCTRALLLDHSEELLRDPLLHTPEGFALLVGRLARVRERMVVAVDRTWDTFVRSEFGTSVETELTTLLGNIVITLELADLDEAEIALHVRSHDLVRMFEPPDTRRAGMLALALSLERQGIGDPAEDRAISLSALLLNRTFPSATERAILHELAAAVGGRSGRLVSYASILEPVKASGLDDPAFSRPVHLVKEPLVVKNDRVGFSSGRLALDALAMGMLDAAEAGRTPPRLALPPEELLLDVVRRHWSEYEISFENLSATLSGVRGLDFEETGYTAILVVMIAMECFPHNVIDARRSWLQGPAQGSASPVSETVKRTVGAAVDGILTDGEPTLWEILLQFPVDVVSSVRGDRAIWQACRSWARGLPLRQKIDSVVSEQVATLTLWRYEDLLDGVITTRTTEFLRNSRIGFEGSKTERELLADVWDGINDGLWDSLWEDWRVLDRFRPPSSEAMRNTSLAAAHLERASFADLDVGGVDFTGADLFLADFRSSRGLQQAKLSGSNWWDAMLAPADRYELARRGETDTRWKQWCEQPPWDNPYFVGSWPVPFGSRE